MKDETPLDMEKIAKRLRGERRGKVKARGGYFGAMQLIADAEERLHAPVGGGRRTNPDWTERRLLPLAPETLKRLEDLTTKIRAERGIAIEPMQLAALILERTAGQVNTEDAEELVHQSNAVAAARRRRRGG